VISLVANNSDNAVEMTPIYRSEGSKFRVVEELR
jgi:hypothetical protein